MSQHGEQHFLKAETNEKEGGQEVSKCQVKILYRGEEVMGVLFYDLTATL